MLTKDLFFKKERSFYVKKYVAKEDVFTVVDLLSHLNKVLVLPVDKRPKVDIGVDVVSDIVEAGTSKDTGNKYAECSQCNQKMLRKRLIEHIVREHTNRQYDINLNRYHDGLCIDKSKGLFLVCNSIKGTSSCSCSEVSTGIRKGIL